MARTVLRTILQMVSQEKQGNHCSSTNDPECREDKKDEKLFLKIEKCKQDTNFTNKIQIRTFHRGELRGKSPCSNTNHFKNSTGQLDAWLHKKSFSSLWMGMSSTRCHRHSSNGPIQKKTHEKTSSSVLQERTSEKCLQRFA